MTYDDLKHTVARAIRKWSEEGKAPGESALLDDAEIASLMFAVCDALRSETDLPITIETPYHASGSLSDLGKT